MKIAVTMRVVNAVGYDEPRDAISHDWLKYLLSLDCIPFLVPNILDEAVEVLKSENVGALILSNGNDVGSPESIGSSDVSLIRDKTEFLLIEHALQNSLPILGVCRGMHIINIFFTGKISRISATKNHVSCRHSVLITNKGFRRILGDDIKVNSFHNYGVTETDLAHELCMFAHHEQDGLCKGLFHPDFPILGMQWHPERANPDYARINLLIREFLNNNNIGCTE